MAILTFLSDFGLRDYYVAAVKGVILGLAPGTTLVDVSHEVAPGDLVEASFLLAAALPAFPPGAVHLAVVDPGVGSGRRMLAIEAALPGHSAPSFLVGPDNGLFEPFLDLAASVVSVDRPDLYRPAPGATFHGRDRFAPIAAALLGGSPLRSLGERIGDPVRGAIAAAVPLRDGARQGFAGSVIHVDRYGNLITNIKAADLPEPPPTRNLTVSVAGREISHGLRFYAEIPAAEAAWIRGSLGFVELSLAGSSLAEKWSVGRGENVSVVWSSGRI